MQTGSKAHVQTVLDLATQYLAALKGDNQHAARALEGPMRTKLNELGSANEQAESPLVCTACQTALAALTEIDGASSGLTELFFTIVDEDIAKTRVPRSVALGTWTDWDRPASDVHLAALCNFVHDAQKAVV